MLLLTSIALLCAVSRSVQAQVFKLPADGWESAGDVTVPWPKQQTMVASPGEGIWAHIPKRKTRVADLPSISVYGDIELEFQYVLAAGTEAVVYLHDAYPINLADSRRMNTPTARSNGGIPGYAPRQEVSRAPGLWQQLKISFKAPQFDASGVKIAPARLLRAELNGVVIHENVQLQDPDNADEKPKAPFRIVAVHGPIAFKDIKINDVPNLPAPQNFNSPDPILVTAEANTTLRSFMDIPGGPRIVHAISTGHPQQVHYSYDLDKGNLFQVWRGGFLDATPMWHDRGNGTSRVLGSPIHFGTPNLTIAKLDLPNSIWPTDTTGTGYKPNGYRMDSQGLPTFCYQLYGGQVEDAILPLADNEGFARTITFTGASDGLYFRLAAAPTIVDQGNGFYLIGDKAWYLKLEEASKAKPIIRDQQNGKELLIPVHSSVRYSIIF